MDRQNEQSVVQQATDERAPGCAIPSIRRRAPARRERPRKLRQAGDLSASPHPIARRPRGTRQVRTGLTTEDRVAPPAVADEGGAGRDERRIRQELVARIRQSVTAGEYLSCERIDATAEQLCQELSGE